jgi:hypothetical protein
MPVIRIVLLVVVGGGLALFAISNLLPVLPLVFLGTKTIALPLAAWIGIALAAGAITSFLLQLLSYRPQGYSTQNVEEPGEVPYRRNSFRRQPLETPEPEPQAQYTPPPPPPERPTNNVTSDWEERSSENWDFQEEPAAPRSKATHDVDDWQRDRTEPNTATDDRVEESRSEGTSYSDSEALRRSRSVSHRSADRTNYEVPQEPKTQVQSGSTYSYSYREGDKEKSGVGKPDVVYDANYRIITPPYQNPPESSEEEDDWGFEDDEDFNNEVDRNSRRQ